MITVLDISQVVWLRKRLSRAQLATKVAGAAAALKLFALAWSVSHRGWVLALSIVAGLGMLWGAALLARELRRGNQLAMKLLMAALFPYAAGVLYVAAQFLLQSKSDWPGMVHRPLIDFLQLGLWIGPLYFMGRGVLAIRAIDRLPAEDALALKRMPGLFESRAKVLRHPAFRQKKVWAWFLIFCSGPFLMVLVSIVFFFDTISWVPTPLLAVAIGSFLLTSSTIIYRQFRRATGLRPADVLRAHDRSPVLYLRSFSDDRFRLFGRKANGRSWLEALFRIRFEEILVDHLFRYGPVIAIGRPLPPVTEYRTCNRHTVLYAPPRPATRGRSPARDWQRLESKISEVDGASATVREQWQVDHFP